jgi:hypothetical protein
MPTAPVALATVLLLAGLSAQERPRDPDSPPSPQSGPPAGRALTELKVVGVAGPRKGQQYDAAADLHTGPAAILFVHDPLERRIVPVVRAFDQECARLLVLGLHSCCVRLCADRTQAEQHTPLVVQSLRMRDPMLVSTDGAEGPGNYALNRKVSLTLVLCRDGVVLESLAYTDTGQNDVPQLQQKLQALAGPLPVDAAGLQQALDRTLPKERAALLASVARLEQDRQRLQQLLTETEHQLEQARGGGRPMDTTGQMREPSADETAAEQVVAAVRQLGRATTAEQADAATADLDKLIIAKPQLRGSARSRLERLQRDGAASAVAKEKAAAWLEKNPK